MHKAAHPLGSVDSSNTRHQKGWRLRHHGDGDHVCCVFMLYVVVFSSHCHCATCTTPREIARLGMMHEQVKLHFWPLTIGG